MAQRLHNLHHPNATAEDKTPDSRTGASANQRSQTQTPKAAQHPAAPPLPSSPSSSAKKASATEPKRVQPPPAVTTATATTATTTVTARRRKVKQTPLSAAERQRRERLRLLQLARRGATIAAALIQSQSTSLLSVPPALSGNTAEIRGARAGGTKCAVADSRAAAGTAERIRATALATTTTTTSTTASLVGGVKGSRLGGGAAALTGAANTATQRKSAEGQGGGSQPLPETTGDAPSADPQSSVAASDITLVPCSYPQLWRGLLQLQLTSPPESTEDTGAVALVTAMDMTKRGKKALQTKASATTVNTDNEKAMGNTPVVSLSSLSDSIAELNNEWRATFLGYGATATTRGLPSGVLDVRGSSCSMGSMALAFRVPSASSVVPAYDARVTSEELYTLRRYAIHSGCNRTLESTRTAVAENVDAAPTKPPSPPRYALTDEDVEAQFFMDYI